MTRLANCLFCLFSLVVVLLAAGQSPVRADDAKIVLFEDPTLEATRLHYPLLISEGRGYRIRCASQADEEAVIRGLGFTILPTDVLTAVDPAIVAADPGSNPLLCPSASNYPIKIFAHDSGSGLVPYLQFPTDFGAATFTDRLYIPGCADLVKQLKLDLTQALAADPTPFFTGKIHKIDCLQGTPVADPPNTFAKWCMKGDRTPAETATVMAVLDSTPGGVSALGNQAACDTADAFLASITNLNLNGRGVQSLEPVAVLSKLTSLSVAGNQISDPEPLTKMRALTFLDISNNKLTSINALAPLTALIRLSVAGNHLTDIRSLSALALLTNLTLDNNQITDLSPLQFLQALATLSIASNGLTGEMLDPLNALGGLKTLNLANNQIETFANLASFPSSLTIDLSGNPIVASGGLTFADTCVLSRDAATPYGQTIRALVTVGGGGTCAAVGNALLASTTLDLSSKVISDLRPLATLPHLTSLNLSSNAIVDLTPLSGLAHLTNLNLKANAITDVRPLAPLNQLVALDVSENPIQVNDFLSGCLMRNQANALNANQLAEVNALLSISGKSGCGEAAADLQDRQFVDATNRGLATVDYFPILANLTSIDLSDNNLTDLAPLSVVPGLTRLVARNNQLSDMQAILPLKRLEQLTLDGNPLQTIAGVGQLNKLSRLYFSDTAVRSVLPLADLPLLEDARMRNLPLNFGSFAEYCIVNRFDAIALGNIRPFMVAIDSRLQADHVDTNDCAAADSWAHAQTSLTLNKKSIIAVDPIMHFRSLQEVNLVDNLIADATPIASLTGLLKLNLMSNRLSTLPRFGSAGLREIYLSVNSISSIGSLAGMPQLTTVELRTNRISDASPLASDATLATADLRGNLIGVGDFATVDAILDKSLLFNNPICDSIAMDNPRVFKACDRISVHGINPAIIGDLSVIHAIGANNGAVDFCHGPACPLVRIEPNIINRIITSP
ncbi:leucine-rich repeat domain-containing protein [Mesorhizobium hawassense]|nr:leucine-rich repeat domain-containing protein [Mesorhizobium hawassense]